MFTFASSTEVKPHWLWLDSFSETSTALPRASPHLEFALRLFHDTQQLPPSYFPVSYILPHYLGSESNLFFQLATLLYSILLTSHLIFRYG
jgi:hypothetical protein